MNRTLNIRIVELLTTEKFSSIKYLYFLTHTTENPNKATKMKITTNKTGKLLICEKFFTFNLDSQINNSIQMEFKRSRFILCDDSIGQLVLPLNWFPSNHIVREWFPIKTANDGQNCGMILLDVHVDCRGAAPFMAPFAPIKIKPAWKRPELSENAEVLVNHCDENNQQNQPNTIPNAIHYQSYPAPCFYPVYQLPPNWQYMPYFQQTMQQIHPYNMNLNQQQAVLPENQHTNQPEPQLMINQNDQQQAINLNQYGQQQFIENPQNTYQSQVYYPQIPMFSGSNNKKSHPYDDDEIKDVTN